MNATAITELREACAGLARPGGSANFVRMFKPRFAKQVKAGKKLQTIRPLPKRIPRCGDTLSLRMWEGKPYRSKQRVLLETKLDEIKVCHIDEKGIVMQPPSGCLLAIAGAKIITLDGERADRFARDDGFADWNEMREWFKAEHGLPFSGVVLYWQNAELSVPGGPAASESTERVAPPGFAPVICSHFRPKTARKDF